MIVLWLAGALAADPFGHLALETSPEATWEVLPPVVPGRIEIAIHDNHVPLDLQLEGRSASGLLDVVATSVGGGTWFLVLYPETPDLQPVVQAHPRGLVLSLVPGGPASETGEPPPPPTLDDLVADAIPRRPGRPPRRTLLPLLGDASPAIDAAGDPIDVPPWGGPPIPGEAGRLLAPEDPTSWEAILGYRQVLSTTGDADARRLAVWRLALAHLARGLPRDADHYLTRLEGEPVPQLPVHLLRARTAARLEDWPRMRAACLAAAAIDPLEPGVLQCLTILAVETGSPSPGAAGALLLQVARTDADRKLAIKALLRDLRFPEALTAARRLVEAGEGIPDDETLLLLGDAEFGAGSLDDARSAWESIRWIGRWGRLARVRLHLLDMLEAGPTSWPGKVPALQLAASRGDDAGAEALHLVAQVAHRYGDPEMEAEALATLLSRHRERARRGDVTSRLIAACSRRLDHLHRARRHVEEVAFYRRCWDRSLYDVVRDTTPVEHAAEAYAHLGLVDAAVDLQVEALRIQTRGGEQDVEALVRLAALYQQAGRPVEALDTVAYTRALRPGEDLASRLRRTAAAALVDLGRTDEAIAELSAAPRDDHPSRLARAALVARQPGGCDRVVDELVALAEAVDVGALLPRCLLESGRPAEAAVAAADLDDPARDGIFGRAVLEDGAPGLPGDLPEPATAWLRALAREESEHAAFEARIGR